MSILAGLAPAVGAGLELAAMIAKKTKEAAEVNVFLDRAKVVADLFDDKGSEAYQLLYAEIQTLCARQGITPSVYYEGAPCINVPLANLIELMDAASD